ncbi:hypothetical protein K883_01370 [Mycobacterium sp. TKK-01-0059]|uniref:hypothetical protein n=1 Tax=Mycobacterium sp. TKK-01-0059 TaxID=1324269 RepID=UPI0004D71705|nr:hypothetical protein [Mycobacterium sp. TKK-01-0059]KEF98367.1 hypothetical protein K883_01370 [Mycobacterium sp. TKK-01-0059]
MTNTTNTLEIYSINDAEDSDPDPIYEGDDDGMIRAFGDVSLDFLFHDDDMGTNVYNVVRADGVVIAVAYRD